ncbi:MAG TPA: allantoate amidohydrolase [Chloroflexia bacterium]|nr:allantoate amidohydrolase [Chloroflexia bacterium]
MAPEATATAAARVMARLAVLGGISEEAGRLTRPVLSEAMRRANAVVVDWMRAAGMAVRQDNIGNLLGRYPAARPAARTLLLGSHLDTVRDAGRFDGPLGVLIGLAAVEVLAGQGTHLPFAVEVLAFADEEGLRYHSAYLGSKVVAGRFDPSDLDLVDADGITLAAAIRAAGGDPGALPGDRRAGDDLLGYCEVHIEQGPVLEARDLPVGVVSAIAGQSRVEVTFAGQAGHAGTVPMAGRQDALCAAAAFILAVEARARQQAGLVATVGQVAVQPGASNVIPGQVVLSLDVRHAEDARRRAACRLLAAQAARIGRARGVTPTWRVLQESPAVACAPALSGVLADAVAARGYPPLYLPSGAGHDAVVMAGITPVAVLFVRCRGGLSHQPAESASPDDVAVALAVLLAFLQLLAGQETAAP